MSCTGHFYMAAKLEPETHQKSTEEVSKIDQKSHRKQNASWLGLWKPLGTIFGGFRLQVGRQVDAKLVPKSKKWGSQGDVKKSSKKMETRVATPGRLSGPLKYSDPDYWQTGLTDSQKHYRHTCRAQGPGVDIISYSIISYYTEDTHRVSHCRICCMLHVSPYATRMNLLWNSSWFDRRVCAFLCIKNVLNSECWRFFADSLGLRKHFVIQKHYFHQSSFGPVEKPRQTLWWIKLRLLLFKDV